MIQTLQDQSVRNSILYMFGALGGQLLLAARLWADHQIDNILDRFTKDIRATIAATLSNVTVMIAAIASGTIDSLSVAAVIAAGILQGIGVDALLNKNARSVWPREK